MGEPAPAVIDTNAFVTCGAEDEWVDDGGPVDPQDTADPVYLHSGEMFVYDVDLAIPGRGSETRTSYAWSWSGVARCSGS